MQVMKNRVTVGIRKGCRVSPIAFNDVLERAMSDALVDHYGHVSRGGRTIS